MSITTKRAYLYAAVLCLGLLSASASAEIFDLAPPPATYAGQEFNGQWRGAVGNRRSFIFEDVSPFQLTSVSIEVNPGGTTTFTASLYAILGADTPGGQLASQSVAVADVGRGFYEIPLSHAFSGAGNRFLLDVLFTGATFQEAIFYDFEGLGDFTMPIDPSYVVGPVRVIDGKGPSDLGEDNFVISHFRIGVVPEPSALALLAMVVGLLPGARRRRDRAL